MSDSPATPGTDAPTDRDPVDILVVDDNPSKLLAIETALTPLGENIVRAQSGAEALRHLLSRDFATVILDVNMPDLDGFETARMIRSRRRSAATPIIFISAVNMDEPDVQRGYSLGAVDYICAPLIPEVLRAKVAVFVELHRKSEEARIHAERLQQRTRELERSQQELRLSERMASVGTLCAGLGHDMGNLLLPLSVWIDAVAPDDLPPDLREGMGQLRTCVQYLRKLAAGLRLVSLDPSHESAGSRVLLEEWVGEVGPILRNTLPSRVKMEIDVPPALPHVAIAPHRLAQVVFNLVQNAGEAFQDRPEGVVRLWAEPAGDGVRIGVSDNGRGMPPEVLERCTDPFFTTKTRGLSTGLGLSLVHGILQSAQARLEIESAPDRGTTFSFILPPAVDRPVVDAWALLTLTEPRQRAIASAILSSCGFDILPEPADDDPRPAVWIAGREDDLEARAQRFTSGPGRRRVLVVTEQPIDSPTARRVSLAGPTGIASALRRFLAETTEPAKPAPSPCLQPSK